MITHQCEACGKTEDITDNADDYEDGGRLNLRGRLCKKHLKVYQELHGAIESEHLDNQRSSLEYLRENVVTEVKKKCGLEPAGLTVEQLRILKEQVDCWPEDIGELTLQNRLDYWRQTKMSTSYPQQGKALDILLADIIGRLESPGSKPITKHAVSLRDLADEWLDKIDRSKFHNHDIQALHSFMLAVATRVEGTNA